MRRTVIAVLILGSILVLSTITCADAQEPDGTVKITRRSVAEAVGLSWGDGLLTYKGHDYPFTFQASGLFREVDPSIKAAEVSGQVFNLKNLQDFNGTYKLVAAEGGSGAFASIRNEKGVVLNLVAATGGHKFTLGADGMKIELKK